MSGANPMIIKRRKRNLSSIRSSRRNLPTKTRVLSALSYLLRDIDTKLLRKTLDNIAKDEALWEALQEVATLSRRLEKIGVNRDY